MVVLKKGQVVTLLTSYCDNIENCTPLQPCLDCIAMCNQFELMSDVDVKYLHEVGERKQRAS